jgi:hypothetical protein
MSEMELIMMLLGFILGTLTTMWFLRPRIAH